MVEKWNSHGGTVWWNSGTVMVEQCTGTVEQSWWNSVVEQGNSDGGKMGQSWCNRAEQWNIGGGTV